MPRTCIVCGHADRLEIERSLVAGESFRNIAQRFATSSTAVFRHSRTHVAQAILESRQASDEARALDVMGEIRRSFERINLLFAACDRWLRDPENPEQYDIGPRADDISVIVWERSPSGQQVQKKRKMSYLLEKLETGGVAVERWETKHADPRELVLKTKDSLQSSLEFVAKLLGKTDDRPQVNVLIAPEWLSLRTAIMGALMPFPDARAAVMDSLSRVHAT